MCVVSRSDVLPWCYTEGDKAVFSGEAAISNTLVLIYHLGVALPCHCGRYRFIHLLRAGASQNNGSGTVFKYLYSLFWGLKKSLYFDFSKCCFWILYISERERERERLHLNLISFMYYFQSNSCSKFCIYTHPVNTTVVRQKSTHILENYDDRNMIICHFDMILKTLYIDNKRKYMHMRMSLFISYLYFHIFFA